MTFSSSFNFPSIATGSTGFYYVDSGPVAVNPLTTVILPNGRSWSFSYDPNFGDLLKLTLPEGGSVTYTWITGSSTIASAGTPASRWVQTRTVFDGTNSRTWTYNYGNFSGTTIVTDPEGNDTVTQSSLFTGVVGNLQTYQGSHTSGVLLKTVTTQYLSDYSSQDQQSNNVANLRPAVETTTFASGLIKTVTKQYDGSATTCGPLLYGSAFDPNLGQNGQYTPTPNLPVCSGSVTDELESGSGVSREAKTSYLWQTAPSYLQANLFDTPVSVKVVDGSGAQASYTTYAYDESAYSPGSVQGALTTVTRYNGSSVGPVSHTGWSSTGMKSFDIDPLQHTNSYGHTNDYAYNQCNGSALSDTWNALNQHTSGVYDCNTGLLTSLTDPNNNTSRFGYDVMNRISSASYPDGGSTGFAYDDVGLTVTKTVAAAPDPNQTTEVFFDGLGRETKRTVVAPSPTNNSDLVTVDTTYDLNGRVHTVSSPHYTEAGPTDGITTTSYDALGRKIVEQEPDNSLAQWCYDGIAAIAPSGSDQMNQTAGVCSANAAQNEGSSPLTWVDSVDEAGVHMQHSSDALGRLVAVNELGSSASPLNLETDYGYDILGDLTGATQHGATGETPRNRSFLYDGLSRLSSSTNPETGTIGYTYDLNSNLHTKTDARGVVSTYAYDALNRITSKTYQNDPANPKTPASTYYYDGQVAPGTAYYTFYNTIGRLSADVSGPGTGKQYGYDTMGRLIYTAVCHLGDCGYGSGLGVQYDLAGNVDWVGRPDQFVTLNTYDTAGRLATVTRGALGDNVVPPQTFVQSVTYFPDGSPNVMTLGNGVQQTITKNNRLQVASMTAASPLEPFSSSQPFVSHTYSYNNPAGGANNGNIWSITDTLDSTRSQSFTYDSLNRINSFSLGGALNQQFAIDSFGNARFPIKFRDGSSFTPPLANASNQFPSMPVSNYLPINTSLYDPSGNLLYDTDFNQAPRQYTWDAESRISAIASLGESTPSETYAYQADGSRAYKQGSDGSATQYFDWGGQPISELSQNGWTDYIYANGKKIAMVQAVKPTIHIHGVQGQGAFGGCGTPFYVTGQTSGIFGYVVQQGDVLSFDHKAVSALSGVWLALGNGTYANSNSTTDVTDTAPDGNWHHTSLDLSNFSGQTVTAVIMGPGNPNTPVGPWDAWVANFSIVSADGGVHPVYTGGTATGSAWGNCGGADTNLTLASEVTQVDSVVGTTYYLGDHLGTAQMEFASGGWPLWQGQFAPFGGELQNGAPIDPNLPDGSTNHYKFTGKERDTESGLDYFGARYYASNMGRWMSPDPMQVSRKHLMYPQRWNSYAYVRNNPLSMFDPDGLDDYYIFLPLAKTVASQWNSASQAAEQHGNHLHFFVGSAATSEQMQTYLHTPEAHVVFDGHTVADSVASPRWGIETSNGVLTDNAHNAPFTTSTLTDDQGNQLSSQGFGVTPLAASVALFGCQSTELSSSFPLSNFVGLDSGSDRETTVSASSGLSGGEAAALAYTTAMSTGQGTAAATTGINSALKSSPFPADHNGDKAVSTPTPPQQ